MTDVENILNDNDFFRDVLDTPKEGTEQYKKQECLKSVIGRGKVHLLEGKWTQKKVDKARDETINKTYAEYKQREITEKGEKNATVWASTSLTYILMGFLSLLTLAMLRSYDKTLRMIRLLKIR